MVKTMSDLPAELLDAIIVELDTRTAIYSLMQTSHHLFEVTTPHLYSFNARLEGCSALPWAAKYRRHTTIAKYLGDQRTIIPPPAAVKEALEAATIAGHTATVKLLLDLGAIEACETDFVARAVDDGHLEIVKLYLDRFAYLDYQYQDKEGSLLHRASAAGCLDVVEYLIEHGLADVTARSNDGLTSLHNAARYGHNEIVALLIGHGADVTAFDRWNNTPLTASSYKNHTSTAQLLLDQEKKLGVKSSHKEQAWRGAIQGGHIEMVVLLLQHEQAGLDSAEAYTVLTDALSSEKPTAAAIAHLLITAGADVNASDTRQWAPIVAAANMGDMSILLRLIERGVDINRGTENGGYAITLAARRGHIQAVKLLLDHGALPTPKLARHAPLLFVAEHGPSDIARLLLERGADTEVSYTGGLRPLHEAAHGGQLEVAKLLIDHGANLHAVSEVYWLAKGHVNAVYWAARGCHTSIVELLLAAGVAPDSPYEIAAQVEEGGHAEEVTAHCPLWHVAGGYFVPTDMGSIYMQIWKMESGAYGREHEIARLLLKAGADVNRRGLSGRFFDGSTALHVAVRQAIHLEERLHMVNLLLANEADVDLTDEHGLTPLHYAACPPEVEVASVIRALLQHGAVVDAADSDGLTPLHYAARNGAVEASDILMDNGADCCAVSKGGITPLTSAVSTPLVRTSENAYRVIVESMLRRNGHILNDTPGWGALHAAARHSQTPNCSLIKLLIENGMSVSATDSDGWTPLLHAVFNEKCSLISSEVNYGSRSDLVECSSPSDLVNCLLKHGADVNAGSGQYASPLSAVMLRDKHIHTVKVLLDNGADINAQGPNKNLDTPLYATALHNRLDAAKLLIRSGAQVDLAAPDGWTPLQIATSKGHDAMVTLLSSAGAIPGANGDNTEPLQHLELPIPSSPYDIELQSVPWHRGW